MLTSTEREEVIQELVAQIGFMSNGLGNFVSAVFKNEARAELGYIPTDINNVSDQGAWVVDQCLASRWHLNPCLLELLLDRLVNHHGIGTFQDLLIRVRLGPAGDPNPDPFQSLWVLSDQPFLSRDRLRAVARTFLDDIQRPILRVNGEKKSGKTYSVELLNYIMTQSRPGLHVVHEELADGNGPTYDVRDLAESLALPMAKKQPIPDPSASDYSSALCRWTIESAKREGGVWVFVLDGFGQPLVKKEVLNYIYALAKRVASPELAKNFRLALFDFGDPFVGNWRPKTVDDGPLTAGGITREHVAACLRERDSAVAKGLIPGRRVTPPNEIDALADEMLRMCPLDPLLQLPTLNGLLYQYATAT